VNRILRLLSFCVFFIILSLYGCTSIRIASKGPAAYPENRLERNDFSVSRGGNVIGRLATVRLEDGDTLPDMARHFGVGVNAISAANPGVDIWAPKAGTRIILPLSFILPDTKKGIVINLDAMRLFHFKGNSVSTYPVGIGAKDRPTPMGQMYVTHKIVRPTWHVPASIAEDHRKKGDPLPTIVPPGPLNPLGEYALYLSKPTYLIHGTNKPASIGLNATNGCIRLYPEHIGKLYTTAQVRTPVSIVHQPYLIGRRGKVIYLEVHTPPEDSGKVYAQLQNMEKRYGRTLDWQRVEEALTEARGIPIPLSGTCKEIEVTHPEKLYGAPEIPELTRGWYILAANANDRTDAVRLAAIINHQGPQIPATVMSTHDKHRVIAGPFTNISEAKEAKKRLKIDLEIDGIVVEPAGKQ
jgi:L,D-transpeptidase ErfK/SrfK